MFEIAEPKLQADDDTLRAYFVGIELKFDLELAQITISSWSLKGSNLKGFEMTGTDLFDMLDRAPAAIAGWVHEHHRVEVSVIPVHNTFDPKNRRVSDGYIIIPIRSMVAAVRALEPKP
jgi:hypothetical protein